MSWATTSETRYLWSKGSLEKTSKTLCRAFLIAYMMKTVSVKMLVELFDFILLAPNN
ncbi:hypothetical protein Sjap_006784 [Stephania japonica]|uniref:Uncharacterized protein n=1 Tax=Stephania japonica TaxID=461633 RepID=A0AAP0K6G8_9MAGN